MKEDKLGDLSMGLSVDILQSAKEPRAKHENAKYRFEYLDKQCIENILPRLFELLYSNMSIIAPTGNTYEQDFQIWYNSVAPALLKEPRQIVLMYNNEEIIGYFQYYIASTVFMMEEIQIDAGHQRTGLFRMFYSWFIEQVDEDILFVEAYSHKNNTKSQGILVHLGLKKCGINKNGNSFHYRGNYEDLKKAFICE